MNATSISLMEEKIAQLDAQINEFDVLIKECENNVLSIANGDKRSPETHGKYYHLNALQLSEKEKQLRKEKGQLREEKGQLREEKRQMREMQLQNMQKDGPGLFHFLFY
jgi:hypothetical protein